jgi:hypothetical protein
VDVIAGLALATALLAAGGLVGWTLGSIILTIRAIEDQDDLWDDEDDL